MKRVISIIISIAMVASLATGLAVTGMAVGWGPFYAYTSDGKEIGYNYEDEFYPNDDRKWENFADYILVTTPSDNTIKIELSEDTDLRQIGAEGDLIIYIPSGKTLTVSNTDGIAISVDGNLTITGGGTLKATSESYDCITAGADINITNSNLDITTKDNRTGGIFACGDLYLETSCSITFNCGYPCGVDGHIYVDNNPLSAADVNKYFTNSAGDIEIDTSSGSWISGTGEVHFGVTSENQENDEDIEEENDPEVEIDFGYGPVTVKTSNKSLVLNDSKIIEKEVLESNNLFVPFDLTKAYIANTKQTKDFDAIFLNNDVYKYISGAGKGIELKNRFAYADVFLKEVGNNPLSLHLSDVSEIAGTCATAIQKKAMNTEKVFAQVNYSFVSNGKPTDNSAKIYVPVPANAKVFYLFNENKIGIVPCEVIDGYCVFDRYFDGTYIVCADK